MRDVVTVIEDLLRNPLDFGFYRVANAPIRYRAIEVQDVRYGWTVLPFLRPVHAGHMLSQHYALTLRLSRMGDWRVEELKPFEWAEHAERWARGLWRDATRGAAALRSHGQRGHDEHEG
jgi:hypothetical protein